MFADLYLVQRQETVLAWYDHFGKTTLGFGHDGHAGGHHLKDRHGANLNVRFSEMQADVGPGQKVRDLCRREGAAEVDGLGEFGVRDLRLDLVPSAARARDEESGPEFVEG